MVQRKLLSLVALLGLLVGTAALAHGPGSRRRARPVVRRHWSPPGHGFSHRSFVPRYYQPASRCVPRVHVVPRTYVRIPGCGSYYTPPPVPAYRVRQPEYRVEPTPAPVREIDPLRVGLAALKAGQYPAARRSLEKAYARTGSRQSLEALILARLAASNPGGAALLARVALSGDLQARPAWDPVALLPDDRAFEALVAALERGAGDSADRQFLAGVLRFAADQPRQARIALRRAVALEPGDAVSQSFLARIGHRIRVAYSLEDWTALFSLLGPDAGRAVHAASGELAAARGELGQAGQALASLDARRRTARIDRLRRLLALRQERERGTLEHQDYASRRDTLTSEWERERAALELRRQQLLEAIGRAQQRIVALERRIELLLGT